MLKFGPFLAQCNCNHTLHSLLKDYFCQKSSIVRHFDHYLIFDQYLPADRFVSGRLLTQFDNKHVISK